MKARKLLRKALRQLKHNNGDEGFVIAYDAKEAEKIVSALLNEIDELHEARLKVSMGIHDFNCSQVGAPIPR